MKLVHKSTNAYTFTILFSMISTAAIIFTELHKSNSPELLWCSTRRALNTMNGTCQHGKHEKFAEKSVWCPSEPKNITDYSMLHSTHLHVNNHGKIFAMKMSNQPHKHNWFQRSMSFAWINNQNHIQTCYRYGWTRTAIAQTIHILHT